MSLLRRATIGVVAASTLGLGFWASKAFYTVARVIDGDTFITKEDRSVRLDSVNAPELEYCLGKEAKVELEKLVLNKKVFIKTTYVDGHKRMVANVYTSKGNVGERMLEKGLAAFSDKGTQKETTLRETSNKAKENSVGIYSSLCTQSSNPNKPRCLIKGNVQGSEKLFRSPGCQSYKNVVVQLYLGDEWFCTEKEAKAAGFIRARDCN